MTKYEDAKSRALNRAASKRIQQVVEIDRSEQLIAGQKHLAFIHCLCVQDSPENPCPCRGPLFWVPSDLIFRSEPTGRKSVEGDEVVNIDIAEDAHVIFEMPLRLKVGTLKGLLEHKPLSCRPQTLAKEISLKDLINLIPVDKKLKFAFAGGYAVGTLVDNIMDGALSDVGADYIEAVVDFWKDLWD